MEGRQLTGTGYLMGTTEPSKENYARMEKIIQKSIDLLIGLKVTGEVDMDLQDGSLGMSIKVKIDEKK